VGEIRALGKENEKHVHLGLTVDEGEGGDYLN